MARLLDIRPKIDVTRGARTALDVITTRENIKRSRAQETRAQETFELNKKAEDIRQQNLVEQEADRVEDREIDLTQKMYGIAVDNGDLEGSDDLLFKLGELSGFPMAGNHVEINGLLNRRAEFAKDEDVDGVEAVDTYMANKFGTTPEGAARMLKRTGEAEGFGAERKFEQKLEQEETQFDITTERTKKQQGEVRESTTQALAGIEGLDETTKALLPLISSGEISGAVLNQVSAQTGVTFRTGLLGTEPDTKGKPVTAAFDKSGKKLFEFQETEPKDKAQRKMFTSTNLLTGETTVMGAVWGEDINGNPTITYVTPQEEEGNETQNDTQGLKESKALKDELTKLGSAGELTPESFLATIEITPDVTEKDIVEAYKKALLQKGGAAGKESSGGAIFENLFKSLFGKKETKETSDKVESRKNVDAEKLGREAREGLKGLPSPKKIGADILEGLKGIREIDTEKIDAEKLGRDTRDSILKSLKGLLK